jgi:hypothetical protein
VQDEEQELETHTLVEDVHEESKDYIFTFGFNHVWPLTGTSLQGCYVKLNGTQDGTRREMQRRFGSGWSFQYAFDKRGQDMIEKYKLAELKLEFPDGKVEFR